MRPLYRLSLEYVPYLSLGPTTTVNGTPIHLVQREWRVHRCWRVNETWADRVIDIDRRHSPKLRLRILGTFPHPKGRVVNPAGIIKEYWKARHANV